MGQGKRYEDGNSKINIKKVIGFIIAVIVIIMCIISFNKILTSNELTASGNEAVLGYFPVYTGEKWGVIDSNGKIIQEPIYDLEDYLIIDFIGRWHLGKDIYMNYYNQI